MSPHKLVRPGPIPSGASIPTIQNRMSKVIEDSIRGHPRATDLEGLACPRTKSPPPKAPAGPAPQVAPTSSYRLNNGDDFHHEYPAMEGLGARFSSYLEKRTESNAGFSKPPGSNQGWESHQGQSHQYRYHYQQQPQQPMTSSNYVVQAQQPRKRSSPSSNMQVLPPKKQHVESGVDYSFHKG